MAPDLVDLLKGCGEEVDRYLLELCENQKRIELADSINIDKKVDSNESNESDIEDISDDDSVNDKSHKIPIKK